ncbi:MAG: GntR family transcriptional regulator [Sphaerochaeta sp.]
MKTESLKLKAYNIIKTNIVECIYTPGSMINEEQLKEELHISRTPIRDALSRIEQEGLIQIKPKKGILVTPITIEEINKIFEVRLLIEPYAIQMYGNTLDTNVLLEYLSFLQSEDDRLLSKENIIEKDDEFHDMIINCIPNKYLITFYSIITSQNKRLRILSGSKYTDRIEKGCREHIVIIEALLKGDYSAASSALVDHLQESKSSSLKLLTKMPSNNGV